jgi:hypothetical protein
MLDAKMLGIFGRLGLGENRARWIAGRGPVQAVAIAIAAVGFGFACHDGAFRASTSERVVTACDVLMSVPAKAVSF